MTRANTALKTSPRWPARALMAAAGAGLFLAAGSAHAGRPLSTDDAATADAGTCQLEAWQDRQPGVRALTLAPACGVAAGLEVDLQATAFRPSEPVRGERGIALKWVPAAARLDTPAGELALGLKLSADQQRAAGTGWRGDGRSALALFSLQASPAVAWHLNLGLAESRQAQRRAGLLNLALAWTPHESVLLFGEVLTNSRREVFGGTEGALGARWWVVPERLGLDFTAARQAGAGAGGGAATRWGVGLGWYGIGR